MSSVSRIKTIGCLVLFAVVFGTLSLRGSSGTSATFDEPLHLAAGYIALRRRDYRLAPEHPPLLHLWAALPALAHPGVEMANAGGDTLSTRRPNGAREYELARKFLYESNDGDELLARARAVMVVFGIGIGCILFAWAKAWFGVRPAVVLLLLYALEPNFLAHSALVTTDIGVTFFVFWSVYCLWCVLQCLSIANVAGLGLGIGLALASKFSALFLPGTVALALLLQVMDGGTWPSRIPFVPTVATRRGRLVVAACLLLVIIVLSLGVVWSAYGFRYLPSRDTTWRFTFSDEPSVQAESPILARAAGTIDRLGLLPNAYTQGCVVLFATTRHFPVYINGKVMGEGPWYYFPLTFLLKVPLALVALLLAGIVVSTRRRGGVAPSTKTVVVLAPVVVYGAIIMSAGLDLGFRHLLPLYPFIFLAAGVPLAAAIEGPVRWRAALAICVAAWCFEVARAYPHTLAFFNALAGGPSGGHRYLVESNLDWGQDLKGLAAWARQHRAEHINLAYFGTADPRYYGIESTSLPGSSFLVSPVGAPLRLPGFIAVSETVRSGLYLPDHQRSYYRGLDRLRPVAVIGHSIRVYWLERDWQ